jgi:hypothetical protein
LAEKIILLERRFLRFDGKVGSQVVFKRPKAGQGSKKNKVIWEVVEICLDPTKVHFREGRIPDYIRLKGQVPDGNGHLVERTLWTCENQLFVLKK